MSHERNSGQRLAPMALAALGVVFGDIGTSPLYAVSACFVGPGIAVTPEHVLGVLSLIFWSLVLVILLKYVAVVLNADNKGEGGVLALTALVINTERASPRRRIYGTLGILGGGLMPALVLNYFGQGAMLIENPAAVSNPFYLMAPEWSLWPLVVIATAATVIASQAVLSGVFSVTTQAVSLGLFPRLRVEHSSADYAGQIYVPTMNWIMMIAALTLVVSFGSSAALAGAYGLAVSGAMTIVTPLTLSLIKSRTGRESRVLRAGLSLLFIIDIAFLLSNLTKLGDGGWLPLLSGFIIYWLMQTWASGKAAVMARLLRDQKSVRDFLEDLKRDPPVRVHGTAIFMDAKATGIPRALLNNIKFNRVIHERVVLLTVVTREQPRIAD